MVGMCLSNEKMLSCTNTQHTYDHQFYKRDTTFIPESCVVKLKGYCLELGFAEDEVSYPHRTQGTV